MARFIYGSASILLAWLLMQIAHESGHVLGAWLTGGNVAQVVLHPLAISRTDVLPNPNPMVEVWAGPIIGVLLPLAVWLSARWMLPVWAAWLRFFTGFCAIANGCYLGYAIIEPIGDAEQLVRLGSPIWLLALFGMTCVTAGLLTWHRLGVEFGIGPYARKIAWRDAGFVCAVLLVVVIAEVCLSSVS